VQTRIEARRGFREISAFGQRAVPLHRPESNHEVVWRNFNEIEPHGLAG
jgi:hypothetical protein